MLTRVRSFALLLAPLVLGASGCAVQQPATRASIQPSSVPSVMSGSLHGGQQPIAFATVQLWTVGTSGYGSQGQLMATTTTADDGYGTFQFIKANDTDTPYPNTGNTWACPATGPAPLIYIIAKGGNTQGTHLPTATNTAAAFLIAAGECDFLDTSTFFTLNEVTTVASMAALTQYFSPVTESIGAPNTALAQTGIYNAFLGVYTLANLSTGMPNSGRTDLGSTFTVAESTKIVTLADILASCVNVAAVPATTCTTLFTNASPPIPAVTSQPAAVFPAATDVLQALWYMLANPSDGSSARVSALFGLVTANPPFQPAAAAVPTDWTVAVSLYPDNTPGSNYNINSPNQISITPAGNPIVVDTFGSFSGYFSLSPYGGTGFGQASSGTTNEVRTVTYDTRNYLWVAYDTQPKLTEQTSSGTVSWTTPSNPFIVAADASGNIFWITRAGALYRIPSSTIAAAGTSTSTQPATTSRSIGAIPGIAKAMVADASGNLWIACGDGNLYEVTAPASAANVTAAVFFGTNFPDSLSSLAIDASGAVLLPYNPSGNSQKLARVSGSPTLGYTIAQFAGTFGNNGVTIDGAGNIFLSNEATYTINNVNSGYEYVLSSAGTPLVTPYGITKPANSSEFSTTLIQNSPVLGPSNSAAVDISGNLWIVNSFQNRFNSTDGPQYTITMLVGAAVPVVPTSIGIKTNTIGTKP